MIEKQQQLTFNKGITNVPSDAICGDGELSDCVGFTSENGELKPVQRPKEITGPPQEKILCVHGGRYLFEYNSSIYYNSHSSSTYRVLSFDGDYKDIATIGNTVIVSTTTETHYALWDGSKYADLGTRIPEPDLTLYLGGLEQANVKLDANSFIDEQGNVKTDMQSAWNDAIIGSYDAVVSKLHQQRAFAEPFVARYAIELYDGSYLLHSSPFIMLPFYSAELVLAMNYEFIPDTRPISDMPMKGYNIYCSGEYDYSDWSDIVKGVSIFVTREVRLFNRSADAKFELIENDANTVLGYRLYGGQIIKQGNWVDISAQHGVWQHSVMDAVPNADIIRMLSEESVFYKLCDMGLKKAGTWSTAGMYSYYVLDNIEVQQQLPNEDFHTHDSFINGDLYSFNGRLHITNAQRKIFEGFHSFFEWKTASGFNYTIVVTIKTRNGGSEKQVLLSTGSTREAIGSFYFYYPDSRATKAEIYWSGYLYKTLDLTEHPGLNGSYWVDSSLPEYSSSRQGYAPAPYIDSYDPVPSLDDSDSVENLQETLVVSEVDNPFLFLSNGYVRVGQSPIVGIAAITMALSEYQHGHLPLAAFTEDGIWSLSISSEGYYTALQAISREVCNNPSSITQVDNGIYFASSKGLMYLDTRGVRCVSTQLKGTEFDEFIDNCMIAYDYRDSLLHIYPNPSSEFVDTYVYNMKTGTFSTLQGEYKNVVNNYPDTLVQKQVNGTWNTYSFLQKPDEQSDGYNSGGTFVYNTYTGYMLTRPMKLENALALKSIMEVRHIMDMEGSVSLKIYASNNLKHAANTWVQLTSLRGKPWKYYKFQYTFTGLKATDRYAGTLVVTQERRTDKLR